MQSHSTEILICHSYEAFKVAMGCNGPIFSLPLILEPLVADGWVTHTWKFLRVYDVYVTDNIPDFKPPRENDCLLIPTFAKNGFSGNNLRLLNQCRLYLQVLWLSEISTGDGTMIKLQAIKSPFQIHCHRSILFPNQELPSLDAWRCWERALSGLCLPNGRRLRLPLGAWINRNSVMWWYDTATQRLYQRLPRIIQEYQIARPSRTRSSGKKFHSFRRSRTFPQVSPPRQGLMLKK
jgi:hypothetical protein